ncbi:MAG TPA: hypothetical protein VLD57_05965 [Blastocatellia bacterium]|nr:hypothetical protein [Blastocatellia bacterium]
MSEDLARKMWNGRSFEEMVMARFDVLDASIHSLEERMERREMETKPLWERALAEIGDIKIELASLKSEIKDEMAGIRMRLDSVEERMYNLERKFDILSRDMVQLRADQLRLEDKLDKHDHKPPSQVS